MTKMIRAVKVITLREVEGEYLGSSPEDLFDFWQEVIAKENWYDSEKEAFVVVMLDTKMNVKDFTLVSLGTLNATLTVPREVFRAAVVAAASSIVLMHNHPSGDMLPSADDIEATQTCIAAGEILGIDVLDHIIIGDSFLSMREKKIADFHK